jgi:hypothetical protein
LSFARSESGATAIEYGVGLDNTSNSNWSRRLRRA